MNDDITEYILLVCVSICGYLIGGLVMALLFYPYLSIEILNDVGMFSFIPLGVFVGIVFLVYFLSKFKVVRREQ